MKKVVLVGNPNSGKSSIFNMITGENQYIGNWAGVTIEKKEGYLKTDKNIKIVDLPGIYSLSPNSPEETIATNFFLKNKPDLIVNIIDTTNIERNLFLTLELLELNIPIIIVLNMFDIVKNDKIKIDINKLQEIFKCNIITTSIKDKNSINNLIENIKYENKNNYNFKQTYSNNTLIIIDKIKNCIKNINNNINWLSIKLLEKNNNIIYNINLSNQQKDYINNIIINYENINKISTKELIIKEKYYFIEKIIKQTISWKEKQVYNLSDKIDKIILNKWLALPLFISIISLMYYISIQLIGSIGSNFINNFIENIIKNNLIIFFKYINLNSTLSSLILDGIINGFAIILTFVPQLALLFLFLSFLEDCGYMSRVAFIMDKIFNSFGLSGKSFIPMLVGIGCTVPAIMSSRTIENEKERKLTIILTPFIPCGAKITVFAFFISIFFYNYSWISSSMYLTGLLIALIIGILLKNTDPLKINTNSHFILEMPRYKIPQLKTILKHVWKKLESFIITGGITISITSTLIWCLQSFTWSLTKANINNSILSSLGKFIAPIFLPLGFNKWQAVVAIFSGILAKENIILTLSILLIGNNNISITDQLFIEKINEIFTPISAYTFMLFILLSSPCIASISAIKKEIGSWKETIYVILFQNITAYFICMLFYQIANTIIINKSFIVIFILFIFLLIILISLYKNIKLKNINKIDNKICNFSCNNCPLKNNCNNKK